MHFLEKNIHFIAFFVSNPAPLAGDAWDPSFLFDNWLLLSFYRNASLPFPPYPQKGFYLFSSLSFPTSEEEKKENNKYFHFYVPPFHFSRDLRMWESVCAHLLFSKIV